MKITALFKAWLIKNCGVSEDASDDDCRKAAAEATFVTPEGDDGYLSQEMLAELTADKAAAGASKLAEALAGITSGMDKINERLDSIKSNSSDADALKATAEAINKTVDKMVSGDVGSGNGDDDAAAKAAAAKKIADDKAASDAQQIDDKYDKDVASQLGSKFYIGSSAGGLSELHVSHADKVNMKWAHTQYSSTKSGAVFPAELGHGGKSPIAGLPIMDGGVNGTRQLDHPSELDRAVAGAYAKFNVQSQLGVKCPRKFRMTSHDEQLMSYALRDLKWGGVIGGECSGDNGAIGVDCRLLTDFDRKALLDDSVAASGGVEIAPIVFDDAIILYAFLSGELFPLVNVVNITRGRRIEGAVLAELTLISDTEGTAHNLFTTTGFVTAFDTNIFTVVGGFEIGLEFISDTPIDIGGVIVEQYGRALLKWLDTQIATGDGTTEPEGVMNASGITSVAFASIAPTVTAYEAILFTVEKRFKTADTRARTIFCSNELSYSRAKGIAVGASDARRVFGMDHEDYTLLNHPYRITESMTNTQLFFGNMARYRLYRRQGMTFRTSTEGETLIRKNTMLITLRARYGGQIEDSGAFAVSTTLQP